MPIPENFKYDVRVRERMLKRGLLTDAELTKHIEAAADVTDLLVEVELKQPALIKESERVERVVSRSAPRVVVPHVPHVRSLENELNDIEEDDDLDDLDDEDDDEDEIKVKAAAKVAAAEKAKAEAAPPPAAAAAEPAAEAEPEAAPATAVPEEGAESDT
jgi:hypothetical protein